MVNNEPTVAAGNAVASRRKGTAPISFLMVTPQKKQLFAEVYETYSDAVLRHCVFRLSDLQTAENVTQETFARLWQYILRGNEVKNVRALIYKIANNLIVDRYRAKKSLSLEALQESNPGFEVGAPSNILERIEVKETIALLKKVNEKYRKVVTMRFIKGLSIAEIAEALHESKNTVSVRIHRGLKQFRELI